MQFVLRPGHGDDQIITDHHERELEPIFNQEWDRLLKLDRSFIDIGAHVGHWTVRAALAGVSVIAIEPQANVRDALIENLRLNGVQDIVDILPYAAWSRDTMLNLDIPTHDEAQGQPPHIYSGTADTCSGSVTVVNRRTPIHIQAYTLDRMFQQFIPFVAGFVKIDVEGSEVHVLQGMDLILRTYRPHLLIEMHDCYYGAEIATAVVDLVEHADYRWMAIRQPTWPHWYLHAKPNA